MTADKRLLLVFEGGLAPGYTAAAVGMTEEGEARGYEIWAASEGFRSLTGETVNPERLVRAVMTIEQASLINAAGTPARAMYRTIEMAGSEFRAERYPGMLSAAHQERAAAFIHECEFSHVVTIGGNGTLQATKALLDHLDPGILVGFINCSVDSDLLGDRAIGFLTALEAGSRVARGLFEDAYTHGRHYILEMMGNLGGKHALHCGCSARAHLIVLPRMDLPRAVMTDIAAALSRRGHSLTIVAEGYKRAKRTAASPALSASEWFKRELAEAGLADRPDRRIIAESYSRFIRGLPPLMMECEIAYLKCQLIYDAFAAGRSRVMAYYLGEHDTGSRPIDEVQTDNGVEPAFLGMIDRLHITSFREHARALYAG